MLTNVLKGAKDTIRAISVFVVVGMSLNTGWRLADEIRNGTYNILNKMINKKKEEA